MRDLIEPTPPKAYPPPALDADQQRVVSHDAGPLIVLGSAGTGKTTVLVEAAVRLLTERRETDVLVVVPTRRAAQVLRDRIVARAGRTMRTPPARTLHAYALDLLQRDAATQVGAPAPTLLPAAECDHVVRDLLRGDLLGEGVSWPPELREAVALDGFAQQLRDLLMRCRELGIEPDRITDLGREHGRADWIAVGRFAAQYARVLSLRGDGQAYDQAELIVAASELLARDPARLAVERARIGAVLVDDAQTMNPAQLALLHQIAGDGRTLLAFVDAHATTDAFRGAVSDPVAELRRRFRSRQGARAAMVQLVTNHRQAGDPAQLCAALRGRLRPGGGGGLLAPRPARGGGTAGVVTTSTLAEQGTVLAGQLHRLHVTAEVPWSQMCVVARGSTLMAQIRRQLALQGVPTARPERDTELGHRPAVAALIAGARAGIALPDLDDVTARSLLTGPLGGADEWWMRRAMRSLRLRGQEGLASLVIQAADPDELGDSPTLAPPLDGPVRRVAAVLRAVHDAANAGQSPDAILWAAWDASGLARMWGPASANSPLLDEWLDDVTAAMRHSTLFAVQHPGASFELLAEKLEGQRSWGDAGLAAASASAARREGVAVLSPQRAAEQEWEVVALVGLQEGAWPDLRPRGGVLAAEQLMALLDGLTPEPIPSAQRMAEERGLLLTVASSARTHLILHAVDSPTAGEIPSRLVTDLASYNTAPHDRAQVDRESGLSAEGDLPAPREAPDDDRTVVARTPSALVADLRRVVSDPTIAEHDRSRAAHQLARLAAAGLAGADPAQWFGLTAESDPGPLAAHGERVRLSPSRIASFLDCELRWFLESAGARRPTSVSQRIGTAVHAVAEAVADQSNVERRSAASLEAIMLDELDRRWDEVDASEGWAGRRELSLARDMVRRLAGWLASRPYELAGTEVGFSVRLEGADLLGTVDRIERDTHGRAHIVDFKTGSAISSAPDALENPQLMAYQVAAGAGAFEPLGVTGAGAAELVHLRAQGATATVRGRPPLDQDGQLTQAHEALSRAAQGMSGGTFRALAGPSCRWCAVREACPVASVNGGLL